MKFTARVIRGSGRGKSLGVPTLNLELDDVPPNLEEGIYACFVGGRDATEYPAVMHYGPRPVFNDSPSCEVHFLDRMIDESPDSIDVSVKKKIRDVQDFSSVDGLKEQMQRDILEARAILKS